MQHDRTQEVPKLSKEVMAKVFAFLRDRERKPLWRIGFEVANAFLQEGECAHYFTRLLYKPWVTNYLDYMGNRKIKRIWTAYKNHHWDPYLSHKLLFSEFMSAANLPTPALLGFNVGDTFMVGGRMEKVCNLVEFRSIIERMLAETDNHSVFLKPVDASQGFGCLRVDRVEQVDEQLLSKVRRRSYLMQETLVQHPEMSRIHAGALSTLRIDTFRTASNDIVLLGVYLRFGSGKSCVDNINAGGLFVGVDPVSGELRAKGLSDICYGARSHDAHPDSGFRFKGFCVPHFTEIKAIVKSAAEIVPYKLIGWDVALTNRGPVLVEANTGYGIAASEMGYGGYYRNPNFQPVLEEAGLRNPRISSVRSC